MGRPTFRQDGLKTPYFSPVLPVNFAECDQNSPFQSLQCLAKSRIIHMPCQLENSIAVFPLQQRYIMIPTKTLIHGLAEATEDSCLTARH